ncbi:PAS domain S-box protein [Dendronalium sp. ChiSLP03b]|uniref:PAS domain S-box protein n=1 Tax=Dendronalium sp. ChiSLP03b TaxID=3075381 RepID=UPI002AD2382B|nr:PAS domain S-box protein [Dendronalium sp. ChiSLP03b]MDZ8204585.1 PAS domain S-box protein [Dendronalium sp. ChiSLP03b]
MTGEAKQIVSTVNFQSLFESLPGAYLVLAPDSPKFTIVAVSNTYLRTTNTRREEILGCGIFEIFPDNPDAPLATGAQNLRRSLFTVLQNQNADVMALQKYDIPRPESEGGGFEERYWSPVNSPVIEAANKVAYIIHRIEDVTEFVQLQQKHNEQERENQALRVRAEEMEAEISSRVQELKEVNRQGQAANQPVAELDRTKNIFLNIETGQVQTVDEPKEQFLILDSKWRYTYVNDRVVEIVGKLREDLLGKSIWELFPDLVGSEFYTQAHRAVTEQRPVQFEYFYPLWNRWFENRIYPTNNGVSILVTEISERERAEATRQRSEERYRAFVDQSSEAIWCFETELPLPIDSPEEEQIEHFYRHCYLAECNQVMAQMYGASSAGDLIGARVADLLVQSDPRNLEYLRAFIRSGYRLVNAESYEVDRQGNPKVFLNNLVGIIEDGMLLRAWGTQRDITDRKRAEAALQESEKRFRQMAQTIQDVFWITDFDRQQILYVSPAYEQIWGQSCESLYRNFGQWIESIHPEDRELVQSAANQCMENGNLSIEYRVVRPDGSVRWVRDRGYILQNEPGQTRRIAGIAEDITERKHIEAALQQSTTILNAINQTSPTLIYVKNREGQILMANPAMIRSIGKPETEIIGKTDIEFHINRTEAEQIVENDRLIMQTGQLLVFEEILEVASGRRTYLSTKSPYRDSQGNIIGLIGIAFDITARKQAQQELQQTLQTLSTLIKASPLPIVAIKLNMTVQLWNPAAERLFGWSETEVLGQLIPIVPEEKQEECRQVRAAVAKGEIFAGVETYRRKRDGSRVFVSISAAPLYDESSSINAIVLIFQDVTAQKAAEAILRQSEERYRYLAESIPQLVWTANADGMLTDVNQRWLKYTGLTLAQAQTAGWQAIIHPDELPTLSQNWVAAQQAGTNYRAEGRMRRADGAYRWHLHQAVPLKNAQGQPIKWFGTATDIENQKQLEQQRQQLLEQEQLARAEAETANRIKDEFLAVLSHELRSPLNPILGWTSLLRHGRLDAEKTAYALKTIERNVKLQVQLIEDLLDVSRILRGKLSLIMIPVNLASTIAAAKETVQLAAQAKSIQIQTVLDPNIGQVLGDSARLQQVIWNLLSNAVKFTPSGGRVEIRLSQLLVTGGQEGQGGQGDKKTRGVTTDLCLIPISPNPQRGPQVPQSLIPNYAQIQISDTGKGIHPDFLPHVFEYFRQEDGATTRKFGGLGLGLAIVRHLVELHGGTVRAESPGEGQGATFTVKLPLLKQDKTIKDEDNSSPPTPDASPLAGIRVLVVDDDADTRELIAFILEQAGGSVTRAVSAMEALEVMIQTKPHVLVSDIGMPDIDGYMLMRQIRAMLPEQGSQILAIALTAYAGEMNQQQALAAGFQYHIAKPVDANQLVQAITSFLGVKKT